jgi:glycerol uptake facilitator-like aquaporin
MIEEIAMNFARDIAPAFAERPFPPIGGAWKRRWQDIMETE